MFFSDKEISKEREEGDASATQGIKKEGETNSVARDVRVCDTLKWQ